MHLLLIRVYVQSIKSKPLDPGSVDHPDWVRRGEVDPFILAAERNGCDGEDTSIDCSNNLMGSMGGTDIAPQKLVIHSLTPPFPAFRNTDLKHMTYLSQAVKAACLRQQVIKGAHGSRELLHIRKQASRFRSGSQLYLSHFSIGVIYR